MFVKRVYLFCDGGNDCKLNGSEAYEADFDALGSIQTYKKAAKKDGWVFRKGNKAYCSSCAAMVTMAAALPDKGRESRGKHE